MPGKRFFLLMPIALMVTLGFFLLLEKILLLPGVNNNEQFSGLIEVQPVSIFQCIDCDTNTKNNKPTQYIFFETPPPPLPNLDGLSHQIPLPYRKTIKPDAKIEKPIFDFKQYFDHRGSDSHGGHALGIRYPDKCVKLKMQGTVLVEFDISAQGGVLNPRIISSPHKCFNKLVLKHVKKWSYAASRGGRFNIRTALTFTLAG